MLSAVVIQLLPVIVALWGPVAPGWLQPSTQLPRSAIDLLIFLCIAACAIRFLSMKTLGDSFSTSLRVRENQAVVSTGPYSIVRHPGYAANGMIFFSTAVLLTSSALVTGVCMAVFAIVWHRRITAEEDMMRKELPAYKGYADRVRYRLLPFVY